MDEEDLEIITGNEIKTESVADAAEKSYVTEKTMPTKTDDGTTSTKSNAPGATAFSAPRNLGGEKTLTTSIHRLVTEFFEGMPEDEAIQNMIQAYYWAGYYKGLYEGLQQAKIPNER